MEKARMEEAKAKEDMMRIKTECDEKVEGLEHEIEVMQEKVDQMRAAESEWKRKVKKLESQVKKAEDAIEKVKADYEKKRTDDADRAKKEREKRKREKEKFSNDDDLMAGVRVVCVRVSSGFACSWLNSSNVNERTNRIHLNIGSVDRICHAGG